MKSVNKNLLLNCRRKSRIILLVLSLSLCNDLSLHQVNAWQEGVQRVDRTGANPSTPVRKPGQRRDGQNPSPMVDPRRWIFIAVVAFLIFGGIRRWMAARAGQKTADRIANGIASQDEIRNSFRHGRAVLPDLLAMLGEETSIDQKKAAFEALLRLWQADELIPEEEKAILTRAFQIRWKQRRKLPRDFSGIFQIHVFIGLPEIEDESCRQWLKSHLTWEMRVSGTRRATDDQWKKINDSEMKLVIEINSRDFPEETVHRIMLHTRATTTHLTSNWVLDLPSQSTSFEWETHLKALALRADFDDAESKEMQSGLIWRESELESNQESQLLQISHSFGIFKLPTPQLKLPLPRDISHDVILIIDGINSHISLNHAVMECRQQPASTQQIRTLPLKIQNLIADDQISHAGKYKARLILKPRPELGWADPEIRSVWPESLEFPSIEIEIVRL